MLYCSIKSTPESTPIKVREITFSKKILSASGKYNALEHSFKLDCIAKTYDRADQDEFITYFNTSIYSYLRLVNKLYPKAKCPEREIITQIFKELLNNIFDHKVMEFIASHDEAKTLTAPKASVPEKAEVVLEAYAGLDFQNALSFKAEIVDDQGQKKLWMRLKNPAQLPTQTLQDLEDRLQLTTIELVTHPEYVGNPEKGSGGLGLVKTNEILKQGYNGGLLIDKKIPWVFSIIIWLPLPE